MNKAKVCHIHRKEGGRLHESRLALRKRRELGESRRAWKVWDWLLWGFSLKATSRVTHSIPGRGRGGEVELKNFSRVSKGWKVNITWKFHVSFRDLKAFVGRYIWIVGSEEHCRNWSRACAPKPECATFLQCLCCGGSWSQCHAQVLLWRQIA